MRCFRRAEFRESTEKKVIDQVAASLILKEFMDAHPEFRAERGIG